MLCLFQILLSTASLPWAALKFTINKMYEHHITWENAHYYAAEVIKVIKN